ncbi:SMP-30/gluconolactonase/LRE family protein [Arenibacter sp. GZD96]|uniref:SMP-30/gluconolactonase/LRE family protein n=1 Tax=Aurantibrevibacter litoralis TaxID=3106030 RepID=UPI002AFE62AA|nr:SMP-30/gluconolactonase/LRE family protein [Arenibacter sp. GZD-96]MEA1786164.1 SMP-30/gluconolactonase/LRE family protein [Arenibacter sp. GZD-96]
MHIETITDLRCSLGEGPLWNALENEILWVDIIEGKIHSYSFTHNALQTYPLQEMVGSVTVASDGSLIVASKSGFGQLHRDSGHVTPITDPEHHVPNNRFNDGKCDPKGRFWAGTMSLSEERKAGSLYVLDGLQVHKKIENVTISNGIAWSLDHKTMYYIDTPTLEVVSYDYDKATGTIGNKQVAIRIPESEGYPDGMTIDNEGMLWIAHWGGWQLTRWNPVTGKKLVAIPLPAAKITSCTFGGENLTDLFVTSAKERLSEAELKEQPLAGALFKITGTGFQGVPCFQFKIPL